MRGKKKNNKNKSKYNPDEIIELLDGDIEMKDDTGDKPNKRKLKRKKKTETNQRVNSIYIDQNIEMKDETKNEENKPYKLSKEETENFQKAFKFYLLKENKQVEELVNDKIIIKKNSENEEQNLSDDIITNYKNKNECLGQIIDINELDIKGKPVFKKLEDGNIIYNGRVFILYPGISTNTKATFRCKFYRKDEKKLQEACEPKFCKSTIIYYYPSKETKEKYIFKTKHSASCDSLHAKSDENIVTAVNDWQRFSIEANDLLNSKTYYYKSDCVKV